MNDLLIDIMFIVTYILLGVSVIGAIVFPIINMIGDFKKAKGSLVGIGIVAVLFIISYALSGSEVLESYEKFGVTATSSRIIGASLIMMYIMSIGAIVMAIVGEVYKAFK